MSIDKDFNIGRTLFDDYKVMSVISKDQNATIYLTKVISTGEIVAMKTLNYLKPDILEGFESVINKQMNVAHPQLAKTYGCEKTSAGRVFQIMEHIEGVSLEELLDTTGKFTNEEEIANLFIQLCKVLADCHALKEYHGNLSPSNIILLEVEGNVEVKLTDFGMGSVKSIINLDSDIVVDESYASPEVLDLRDPSAMSDVYSLALVAYKTVCGELPFRDKENGGSISSILKYNQELLSAALLDDLFQKALLENPKERIDSISEFQTKIENWLETVTKEKEVLMKLELEREVEDEADGSQSNADLSQLKQSVHDIVTLKHKQLNQEETIAMKFSDMASTGPRQSPLNTVKRVSISAVAAISMMAALVYSFIMYEEPIRKAWKESSTSVSATVFKKKKVVSEPTENEVAQKSRLKATKASIDSPLIREQTKVVQSRRNAIKAKAFKESPFYYEQLPAEKLLIKRPYHPPANKKVSNFTNNVR